MMATSNAVVFGSRCTGVGQQPQQHTISLVNSVGHQTQTQITSLQPIITTTATHQTSQTTQTSLSSATLPALVQQQQQKSLMTVISVSPSITITTTTSTPTPTTSTRKQSSVVNNGGHQRSKQHIPARPNGIQLYEGSHIHYSPVDNKPLCSYSTKLCKQRRINGYAFCIRHILEDPSAPFRQCRHVAKYNQQKCSNAIPATEDRLFCNSHMQIAGMAPKKERKDKKASTQTAIQTNTNNNNNTNSNQKCVSSNSNTNTTLSSDNSLTINTINDKLLSTFQTTECFTNFNAFIKPTVKLNGITGANSSVNTINNTSINNILNKINSNINNNNTINNNIKKSIDKSTTTTATTTVTTATTTAAPVVLLNDTTISCDSSHKSNKNFNTKLINNNNLSLNNNKLQQKTQNLNNKPKPKRKKKDNKKCVDRYVFARKKPKTSDNIFNYHIWSESDDEEQEDEEELYRKSGGQGLLSTTTTSKTRLKSIINDSNSTEDDMSPQIFGTLSTNYMDLESSELKSELITQKWLLRELISIRKSDFGPQLERTRNILKTLNTTPNTRSYSYLDYKLSESAKRSPNSIRKGICCYASEESGCCRRPSLPYTRHCVEHILYNVDQLLFSRCTAKCAQTMTQCSHSTFDITREEPLCHYHQLVGREMEAQRPTSPSMDGKGGKKRKKPKPMALTRVSRRGKKRRKGKDGPDIPVLIEDSIDGRLSIGSVDEDSVHSHSDTNDISINLLAQKPDSQHIRSTDIIDHKHNINVKPLHNTNTNIPSIPQSPIITTTIAATIATTAPIPTSTHTTTSVESVTDIPLMRLVVPQLVMPSSSTITTPTTVPPVVMAPPVVSHHHSVLPSLVDPHSVMPPPPPLEPTEEALVASIVADLPQLTNDADFTEVLNKIPDDAFSDFLLEHQNGDIPTTEETEALEQALAMVNKDVQNLVAVAGMNGNSGSGGQLSDVCGQTDIIGFTNWLGSLTTEQRQQLNGLIDGAIASNSLSPILKNACESYPQTTTSPICPSNTTPILMKSTVPIVVHNNHNNTNILMNNSNAFPLIYPINQLSLGVQTPQPQPPMSVVSQQLQTEFVPISSTVPLLNNNLLMNGLSPHPS